MAENVEKEYYKDILELIDQKSQDSFYQEMLNAIKGGKLEVYQKRTRQQLTFDATWIEVIKNNLSYVEAIVRNPRQFMEANEEVTPIQRAKKINYCHSYYGPTFGPRYNFCLESRCKSNNSSCDKTPFTYDTNGKKYALNLSKYFTVLCYEVYELSFD